MLVARGRLSPGCSCAVAAAVFALGAGGGIAMLAAANAGLIPWFPARATDYAPGLAIVFVLGALFVALAVFDQVDRRAGRVDFFDDHVDFFVVGLRVAVPFENLLSYSDREADWIEVRAKATFPSRTPLRLDVPTTDEATRMAVLALLDRKGVPRLDV